jgi:type VI secretion system secreted protein VgrG
MGWRIGRLTSPFDFTSCGRAFSLTEHSLYGPDALASGANRFVVLRVTHEAANNLGSQAAQILLATDIEQGSYRNQFQAVPATTRLVPTPIERPTAPGMQTATVVAAEGEPLTTDRDGRIRIQFGWQRGTAPLPGGLSAPTTPTGAATGHAPGNERSGTWVRVAQSVAGPNWGAVFTPRAGTEVLVDFVDGDIDRPIVVGQLHNGQHDLPWPAGVDASANHPGTVSGWHSQHLDGQGANQWLIDDATGQLRMRLASHSAATGWNELSLGHLIQHSGHGGEGHARRGQWLGSGFYGATDGWAVVRAAQGLLLTTSSRPAQGASVASTQMDAAEAVAQLRAARQLGEALSQSARQQGAQGLSSHDGAQAWQHHTDQMDPQAQGRYEGSVGGQEAKKGPRPHADRAGGALCQAFAAPRHPGERQLRHAHQHSPVQRARHVIERPGRSSQHQRAQLQRRQRADDEPVHPLRRHQGDHGQCGPEPACPHRCAADLEREGPDGAKHHG